MTTSCLIVDDEPLARQLIRDHLMKVPGFEVVGECGTAMEAMAFLRSKTEVHLLFLDIQMPQVTGLDFLRSLSRRPQVIITTAYREYALEGFDLNVVDYLLKPVTFERFFKALSRFCQHQDSGGESMSISAQPKESDHFIYVKENKRYVKVAFDEIDYIEGFSEYIKIYYQNKRIVTKLSLTWMEEQLPVGDFLRIHKSFIISLTKIDAFTANSIEVGGKELPIGRSYKNSVAKSLHFPGVASKG